MREGDRFGTKKTYAEGEATQEERVDLLTEPTIINGRTMVGVRGVFENMNVDAHWDNRERLIKCIK